MFSFGRRKCWKGITEVFYDDSFLVSYPRSGNTWVRFLLAALKHDAPPSTFEDLEINIPDIHTSLFIINNHLIRPRIIKSHFYDMPPRGKVLYLYRDGRDCLLSFYFYLYPKALARPSFLEFFKMKQEDNTIGSWSRHVEGALSLRKKEPDRIFMLPFEKLFSETELSLAQVTKFLDIHVSNEKIKSAVDLCLFEKLQKMENQSRRPLKEESPFFRVGAIEQWKKFFSADELEIINKNLGKTLRSLGYPLSR